MAKVECEVQSVTLENDDGRDVDGICVECGRCGHEVNVFGDSDRSVRRGLALLREECPNDEENWYVTDEEDE